MNTRRRPDEHTGGSSEGLLTRFGRDLLIRASAAAIVVAALIPAGATPVAAVGNDYTQTNLVSDIPGVARVTDPNLVNPWGMAASPTSPVWVSDNGTDVSTLYSGGVGTAALTPRSLVVSIPHGAPTGVVFNPSTNWNVSVGGAAGPAAFIFASEKGWISAWNAGVPPPAPSTQAQPAVKGKGGAIYKGLAITTGTSNFLYAANFAHARIDVFDATFNQLNWKGAFEDPTLPDHYAPFNIANIGGMLYVTYALQGPGHRDDVKGPGNGYINVFDLNGVFVKRFASQGVLNSPWGLAVAPAGWGAFGGDLLVGNFGDGRISAFDPTTGALVGQLMNSDGNVIAIDGLWALQFGNGTAGSPQSLLFTAGIADEEHGLMGKIEPTP